MNYLRLGHNGLAVRLPAGEQLQALLTKTGPLLTTSANHPDEPTAATIQAARQYFNSNVDFYIDGGNLSGSVPSTIIGVVDDAVEVLRPGAVIIKT
jgi:tRNA A37 threonylcarbamoyladenosine synthetase subunit TsaC/SUA5/YrdC